MANSLVPFAGYDTSLGNKKEWLGDHYGPVSYPTGGYPMTAAQLGWGGLEFVTPLFLTTQTINATVSGGVPTDYTAAYFISIKPAASTAQGAVASVTVQWYVISTGAEVTNATNMSAIRIRLNARGV